MKLERRWRELIILLILVCVTTPIFWLTDLDFQVAALFYYPSEGNNPWTSQDWWLWNFLYHYASAFTIMTLIGAAATVALGYFFSKWQHLRRSAIYLFLVIALGPGLVVNLVFKDHWGRPRPLHMTEFGGQDHYIPPLQIGHTAGKSFVCGHCSVGFSVFSLYFLSRKRKGFYFALTLIFSSLLAFTRLTAGGHFLSDILWSGDLVFFVAWLVYYSWYARIDVQITD